MNLKNSKKYVYANLNKKSDGQSHEAIGCYIYVLSLMHTKNEKYKFIMILERKNITATFFKTRY